MTDWLDEQGHVRPTVFCSDDRCSASLSLSSTADHGSIASAACEIGELGRQVGRLISSSASE